MFVLLTDLAVLSSLLAFPFSDYDAAIWRQGSLTPSPGTLYFTEHYVCFDQGGELHVGATAISMKEIAKISKETTLGITSNSIKLVMSDDTAIWFLLIKRDAAFEVLDKLWQQAIDRLHKLLDPESAQSRSTSSNKAQLDQVRKSEEFRKTFRVPDEVVQGAFGCDSLRPLLIFSYPLLLL